MATSTFPVAATTVAPASPRVGCSHDRAPTTPATAPAVFQAYRVPTCPVDACGSFALNAHVRSNAAKVAPMATVPGSNPAAVTMAATAANRAQPGSAPVHVAEDSPSHRNHGTDSSAHAAIPSSNPASHLHGREDRRMRPDNPHAPAVMPRKNAVNTAKVAGHSWPSVTANRRVHASCKPNADAPERNAASESAP